MKNKLTWHKRYHEDALNGFMDLDPFQRGIYQTFLDLMYHRWAPLPNDLGWLAGWCRCSRRKVGIVRDQLIQKGKIFYTEKGEIFNSRVQKEIAQAELQSEKNRENRMKTSRKSNENQLETKDNSEINAPTSIENKDLGAEVVTVSSDHTRARSRSLEKKNKKDTTDNIISVTTAEQSTDSSNNSVVSLFDQGQLPEHFAFDGKIIKLTDSEYQRWAKTYPDLKLEQELFNADLLLSSDTWPSPNIKNDWEGWLAGRFVKRTSIVEAEKLQLPENNPQTARPEPTLEERYRTALEGVSHGKDWPHYAGIGSAPGEPGCRVPKKLLIEFGFVKTGSGVDV